MTKHQASVLFSGLIPIIIFTIADEYFDPVIGLTMAMLFGIGEMFYEKIKYNKIETFTLVGNGLILVFGLASLAAQDGIWFKLQPAIMELIIAVFLFGSWGLKKPLLSIMIEKQNPSFPQELKVYFSGITFRMSFFFLLHSILATYAAFYWTTTQWALLKGVGITVTMIIYMLVEVIIIRHKVKKHP